MVSPAEKTNQEIHELINKIRKDPKSIITKL